LVSVWIIFLLAVSYQPTTDLAGKLENLKNIQSFEERGKIAVELKKNKSKLDDEIKNILEARKCYFFAKNDNTIKIAYKVKLKFSDGMADFVQNVFTKLAYPFVYQGAFYRNETMANDYKYLFGYRFGESSHYKDPYKAVSLVSRNTTVKTDYQGLLATISIEEEYESINKYSFLSEEVVYEFSLPQNSVITDLKLGPNFEFDGLIAPKGAAKKVYHREISRRKDPAVLEQTGPRQYRLRVFPIPGKRDAKTLGGKNQKVKFSYVAELTSQGYPLPVYTKEKSIVIDEHTEKHYYLDGKNVDYYVDDSFIKKTSKSDTKNKCGLSIPISIKTPQSDSVSAYLVPYNAMRETAHIYECDEYTGINVVNSLKGAKFAILYDVSHSNKDSSFWGDFIKLLSSEKSLIENNIIDLYLFNDTLSKSVRIDSDWIKNPRNIIYFGESNWINQINKIDNQYDFIVIATTNADILDKNINLDIKNKIPLYIIHKDNKVPAYPEEVSNYILQNNGKVASSLRDALTNYALSKQIGKKKPAIVISPLDRGVRFLSLHIRRGTTTFTMRLTLI